MISTAVLSVLILCGCSSLASASCDESYAEGLVSSFSSCKSAINCSSNNYCYCCDEAHNMMNADSKACCNIYDTLLGEVRACNITAADLAGSTRKRQTEIAVLLQIIKGAVDLSNSLVSCLRGSSGGGGGDDGSGSDDGIPGWGIAVIVGGGLLSFMICLCCIISCVVVAKCK